MMERVLVAVRKLTLFLMALLTGLNVVTMCAGVVSRFVVNISLGWTDELGAASLVWITYLGAALLVIDGKHMSIDLLVKKFNPKTSHITTLVINLLMMFFMYLMARYGYIMCRTVFNEKLASIPVSRGIVMSVIPLSGLVMFVFMATRIVETVKLLFADSGGKSNADRSERL